MRILKILLGIVAVIVVALAAIAFVLPTSAHIERTITIARPPSQVYGVLEDIHRFNAWSPWFDIDPAARYTYSGPARGVGAKFAWHSEKKEAGSGTQEIVAATPNSLVRLQLDFGDMGRPTADFKLSPEGATATRVVWTLDQSFEGNVVGRFFGPFLDRMVGPDYERGLAKLKTLVETFPTADITGIDGTPADLAAQKIYFVSAGPVVGVDAAKAALTDAYRQIGDVLRQSHLEMAGAPLTITTAFDAKGAWTFDAAIPVAANDAAPTGAVKAGSTYAGKAVQFVHAGPYDKLADTVSKAYAWLAVHGYKPADRLIEEYVSDPATTPPEQLRTVIKIPVAA